jgi:hypothetical protein
MPPAPASPSRTERLPTICFSIVAEAEPGTMPRVLELFAKRGLVPTVWYSRASAQELIIDLQIEGFGGDASAHIAACLRQIPTVHLVLMSEKSMSGSSPRAPGHGSAGRV